MYCNCFYCTGYTKGEVINLKERIADREIEEGIEEFETNTYEHPRDDDWY